MENWNHIPGSLRVETNSHVLRVLFLEPQPCIRALKYAMSLKKMLGDELSLWFGHAGYSLSELYGFGEEYFDNIFTINHKRPDKDIRRIMSLYEPHIVHSHNAPDTFTIKAIDAADVPVIHDVHEVLSVHNSGFFEGDNKEDRERYYWEERKACEESDGQIFATGGIKEYAQKQYNFNIQKSIVLHNYVSSLAMPKRFKKKLSANDGEIHIVYIGCVTSVVQGSHYDLRNIFKEISNHKLHVHIYPTKNSITKSNKSYQKLAASNPYIHYHPSLSYKKLLYEITKYDFGWAGYNNSVNSQHLNIAIQNKIFDYISSGLPVIAFPYTTLQRFLERYGVGLIIESINDLPQLLKETDVSSLRTRTVNARNQLTFEHNIPKLLDFYTKMIGASSA